MKAACKMAGLEGKVIRGAAAGGLALVEHTVRLRTLHNCFSGAQAVEWCVLPRPPPRAHTRTHACTIAVPHRPYPWQVDGPRVRWHPRRRSSGVPAAAQLRPGRVRTPPARVRRHRWRRWHAGASLQRRGGGAVPGLRDVLVRGRHARASCAVPMRAVCTLTRRDAPRHPTGTSSGTQSCRSLRRTRGSVRHPTLVTLSCRTSLWVVTAEGAISRRRRRPVTGSKGPSRWLYP